MEERVQFTDAEYKRYLKNRARIPKIVLKTIKAPEVIYGERAISMQMKKKYLKMPTEDYDVYSEHPKQSAKQTEQLLDKKMGFNAFEVMKGSNPGTHRVRSRVTAKVVADYTKPENKIPYRTIKGKRVATLKHIQQHTLKTLKEGIATHRLHKDKLINARININKTLKHKRKYNIKPKLKKRNKKGRREIKTAIW